MPTMQLARYRWFSLGSALLLFCFLISTLLYSNQAYAATQATFYVSPTGNDNNPGTLSAPFKTIQKARDTVRTLNSSMTGDIEVYLKGGTYFLNDTINFNASDSGTNGYQVRYEAYPGEKPIISGGVRVSGWTQDTANPKLYKAPLARDKKLRALYVNDQRANMTSKSIDALSGYGSYVITAGQADWALASGSEYSGTVFKASDLPLTARNQSDIELETQRTWNRYLVTVDHLKDIGNGQVAAMLQMPYGAIAQRFRVSGYVPKSKHEVYNVFEWLASPGQFYFDRESQTVYYYPRPGEDMSTADVIAPSVETLVRVEGTPITGRANHITFKGISFAHSDFNLYHVDNSSGATSTQGASIVVAYGNSNDHQDLYRNFDVYPGAVKISSANDIRILDGEVKYTGAVGILIENDVQNITVTGNNIYSTGGSAISIGHPQHVHENDPDSYKSSTGAPASKEKFARGTEGAPRNISITNNYILEPCKFFPGSAGVMAYYADTLIFQHNRIEKTPYQGLSLGWGWWNFNGDSDAVVPGIPTTTARNNNISYNQFIDTMSMLNDGAPIYTLGSQLGTTISNNYIKGVPAGHKYALHPDEGSAFIAYVNNLIDVDPGIKWIIESGTWGRQHDLTITPTYGNINKVDNKNVPNSNIQDVIVYSDSVWPTDVYNIALNSGLEAAYKDIIPQTVIPLQDYILPASVFVYDTETTSIPIRSVGDESKSVWLAPAGTTTFTESATMTKASGTATSISLPAANGSYKLYIIDRLGYPSVESTSQVRVGVQGEAWVDDKSSQVTYNPTWSNWNDTSDYGGSESFTASTNSYAQLTFTGTAIKYIGMKQPNMGKVDVYVDGELAQADIDSYAPSTIKKVELFNKSNLTSGSHTIKIVCKGTKNDASSGTTCAIDAFAYQTQPKLFRITEPLLITASIGSAKTASALGLPETVQMVTDTGSVNSNVTWDLSRVNYDPTATTAQTFTLTGSVTPLRGISNPNNVPLTVSANVTVNKLPQSQMTATATSQETIKENNAVSMAIDGNSKTFWHTKWDKSDILPQSITLNLGRTFNISKVTVLPRPGGGNGNITDYNVYVSTDGSIFTKVATGSWVNDATEKTATFIPANALYVKLEATAGVGGFASAAEINVFVDSTAVPQLVGITTPAAITGVANGAAKTAEALGLPSKVELVTDTGSKIAHVTWRAGDSSYDPVVKTEQTFAVIGTVTLPEGVTNPNNVALTTSISVTVNAATKSIKAVLSGNDNIMAGTSFDLNYGLQNVTGAIYAQDLTIVYDPAKLEFVSANSLKEGFTIVDQDNQLGQIHLIAASLGEGKGVNADGDLLALHWKAKVLTQTDSATIQITNMTVADREGTETPLHDVSHQMQILATVTKDELKALTNEAQRTHDAAAEGTNPGQFPIGSKTVLQAAIDKSKVVVSDEHATQQQVDQAMAELSTALQKFKDSVVKRVAEDLNGDGKISVGDLAIVANYYGGASSDPNWSQVKHADINEDGKIDIVDLSTIAKKILETI